MVGVSNANASKKGLGRRPMKSTVHGAMELLCYLLFHAHPLLQIAITKSCYMLTPQYITWHCPNVESRIERGNAKGTRTRTLVEAWHIDTNK